MYSKNEIKQMIFRLDFADKTVDDMVTENPKLIETILSAFKTQQPDEIQNITSLTPDQSTPMIFKATPIRKITKCFSAVDGESNLKYNSNMLVFTTNSYSCKRSFTETAEPILASFLNESPNCLVSRVGLRFINIFDSKQYSSADFSKKYKSFLLNGLSDISAVSEISQMKYSQSIIHEEIIYDDIRVRLNFGLYNPTMPSPLKNRDVLIDIDAIYGGAIKTFESVINIFKKSQSIAESVFEIVISDSMRKKLGDVNE